MKEIIATTGRHNGGMSLFLDGVPQASTFFKITEPPDTASFLKSARTDIPAMARQGITLCWVPVFLGWKGPGDYDFCDFDLRVTEVLRLYDENTPPGAPRARVGIRPQAAVFHPKWHIDAHRDANGAPTNLIEWRNPWGRISTPEQIHSGDSTVAISLGDRFWDTHAVDCLKAMVGHARQSAYADRIFGWLPCALNTNEWFLRTFTPGASCDFSAPTQQAFRAHLAGLGLNPAENPVPAPQVCANPGHGEFLTGTDGRLAEEFSLWINHRVADIALNFARTIREATADSPKLIGLFYGYSVELSYFQDLAQSGHLALDRVLDSPHVDFLCSPCSYRFRADEGEYRPIMVLGPFADSAAIRGKLVFAEDDHYPVFQRMRHPGLSSRDRWHDEMTFRNALGRTLTSGQQLWWYALGSECFRETYRQDIVGDLHRMGMEAIARDRSPVAEVAVVVDERSVSAMRLNAPFQRQLILESFGACAAAGVPIECHELRSFLDHADHSRFKVVIFLNLFLADAETLAKLDRLKTAGRTLIFQFAPGLLTGAPGARTFSPEQAGNLAGMTLAETDVEVPLTVWMDPERVPMADGKDIRFGWINPESPVSPVLAVTDPQAVPLGFLHTDRVGFAMRRHADWTTIFSAPPCIPSAVLRAIFKDAGVAVYADSNEVIYANRSMLVCCASSRGEKTLTLPNHPELVDALTGERIQPVNGKHSFFMKRHETRIFWMEKNLPSSLSQPAY